MKRRAIQRCEDVSGCEAIVGCSVGIIRNRAKSGSGAPGPKSVPRDTKSATFAKGIFQPFDLPKFLPNPIREPSFS